MRVSEKRYSASHRPTQLAALLLGVGIVGAITGRWAMRETLNAPVVGALRGE